MNRITTAITIVMLTIIMIQLHIYHIETSYRYEEQKADSPADTIIHMSDTLDYNLLAKEIATTDSFIKVNKEVRFNTKAELSPEMENDLYYKVILNYPDNMPKIAVEWTREVIKERIHLTGKAIYMDEHGTVLAEYTTGYDNLWSCNLDFNKVFSIYRLKHPRLCLNIKQ